MDKKKLYSQEVKERAVRMVQEHRGEHRSLWAAIESIAPKIGCVPQTLNEWVRKHEIDTGTRDGGIASRRWSARTRNWAGLTKSSNWPALFLPRRSSTADSSDERFRGPAPQNLWGRASLQGIAEAPSGYRRHTACKRTPELRCERAKKDERLMPQIEQVWQDNMHAYGADKVWHEMNRQGAEVARCTVERLMKRLGLEGVRRGKVVRTTIADEALACPLDRVNRQFKADRPNQLWVSDFTYVSTWQGWLYVAFVIDVFARRIVGWRVSRSMRTDFVLDALEQALYDRQPERSDALIHHSDRGSQYVSIIYTERLAQSGIEPSVGSRGDSYDNALAETINRLYKAELIYRRAPWKTREAVELVTLEWVTWFNHHRLLGPIGYIPPAEAEANYYRQLAQKTDAEVLT